MAFDQYHEPPNELPEETRTFARMILSLIEEAQAIDWYEQRMVVEKDSECQSDHAERPAGGVQALRDGPGSSCGARSRSGGPSCRTSSSRKATSSSGGEEAEEEVD